VGREDEQNMCSRKYNMTEYKNKKKTTLEQAIENMKH
jgi:hypothetical protein